MSLTDVSEDPFVISESFAKKIGIVFTEKRVINVNKNTIPLNLYGKDGEYKSIPDIGEMVRPDGLLYAHRTKNIYFNPADLTDEALRKPRYNFDSTVYVRPGSKIVDIKVIKGNYRKPEFPKRVTERLDARAESLINFYRTLKERVDTVSAGRKNMFSESTNYDLSPRLTRLLVEGEFMIGSTDPRNKLKLVYKKLPVEEYRIEITTKVILNAQLGYKLTDQQGGKGVVTKIMRDEDMPVDEYGVRVDVIADPNSTIARQNPGRTYELYMGAFARDNFTRFTNVLKQKYTNLSVHQIAEIVDDADVDYVCGYLHGMYSLVSENMANFIPSLTDKKRRDHVKETLKQGIVTFHYRPNDPVRFVEMNRLIEQSIYKPNLTRLTMRDNYGVLRTTVAPIRIGVLHLMVLEKTADTYMAVSSAHLNNFGFPAKVSPGDKHKTSHAITPAKTLGETELRLELAYMGKEAVADLVDSVANPYTHKLIVKSIFTSENPMQIGDIDRQSNPYGNTKALLIFKHTFNASGIDFKYVKENLRHE
jgi:protein associated with RNAse G/E